MDFVGIYNLRNCLVFGLYRDIEDLQLYPSLLFLAYLKLSYDILMLQLHVNEL